jgi:hypothetical protein
MKTTTITLLAAVLLVGCMMPRQNSVTLTSVVDSAAVAYAKLYSNGLVTAELVQRIAAAHQNFRVACAVAKDSLSSYKTGGAMANPEQYNVALTAAQQSAQQFVQLLLPLLPPHDAIALQQRLKDASTP